MIHVACSANDKYAPHAATLIRSLAKAHPRGMVQVHFLCDASLTPGTRDTLAAFCRRIGVGIDFRDVGGPRFDNLLATSRVPTLCWYRTCLDEFLPQLDRVLYLDTDIVATESLQTLFDMDMGDALVGVVNDYLAALAFPEVAQRIGIAYRDYFNSGVMLLNLKAIRAAGGGERILQIARDNHERLHFPDQDALNLALGPRCKWLDPRWNFPPLAYRYFEHFKGNPQIDALPACREVRRPDFKPALLHFLAHPKPWETYEPYPGIWEYHRHRARTPWPPPTWDTFRWWVRTHVPAPLMKFTRRLRGLPAEW